jgi:antitoxin PrlF
MMDPKEVIQVSVVTKISPQGEVVVPAEIRRALNVQEGDRIVWQITKEGRVEVTGLPTFTSESVIGILPYHGKMPSFEELRRKARHARVITQTDKQL